MAATEAILLKMLGGFAGNTLLADQMDSFGFGKVPTKEHHQKFKKPPNIYKMEKY